jgi:uncharacterized membrane protein YoaK (UPF0700 family)
MSSGRERALVPVLLALTAVTGLVDAASVLGLGRVFTANMTGNVVFLGFAAAGAPGLSLVRSGAAFLAFLVGAVIGGRIGRPIGTGSVNRPTVATMFAGAAVGAWLVARSVAHALAVAGVISALSAVSAHRRLSTVG